MLTVTLCVLTVSHMGYGSQTGRMSHQPLYSMRVDFCPLFSMGMEPFAAIYSLLQNSAAFPLKCFEESTLMEV